MRRGELFKLVWSDVDLDSREIHIQAMNAKTMKPRTVPISERVSAELCRLYNSISDREAGGTLVFGISEKSNVWDVFQRICEDAGLEGLRLHDLRHTFATRQAQAGMPVTELAGLLGHTVLQTTMRYCNATTDTVKRAADILNSLNGSSLSRNEQENEPGGFVN